MWMMAASQTHKVVVLGGGYAGLTAAARIAEANADVSVILVDAKPQFVERIRLHEVAGGSTPRDLPYADFMTARNGCFVQARVLRIDATGKSLDVAFPDRSSDTLPYDTLVYAPGSMTDRWSVPGVDTHAARLDDQEECTALRARFADLEAVGGSVLIAGGGLTAIEAACELGERLPGLRLILAPGRTFGPGTAPGDMSKAGVDHIRATLTRLGIDVRGGARISRLYADRAAMEDGSEILFDTCIWCAGFVVPKLAGEAGIAVNEAGEVITDDTLTSVSHPDILALGDAAHVITDEAGKCRMSCAAGRPMGERAAATVLDRVGGISPDPFEFRYSFRCVSLGRDDGLIQFVDAMDRPVETIWTGERGAAWKEYICRRTLAGIGFDTDLGPPPDTPPQIS